MNDRLATGVPGLDALYGGGLTPGSVNLLSGPPMSGKTHLLFHVISNSAPRALYSTSPAPDGIQFLGSARAPEVLHFLHLEPFDVEDVLAAASDVPFLVLDDAQRMRSRDGAAPMALIQDWAQKARGVALLAGSFKPDQHHEADSVARLDLHRSGLRRLHLVKNRYGPADPSRTFMFRLVDGQVVEDVAGE